MMNSKIMALESLAISEILIADIADKRTLILVFFQGFLKQVIAFRLIQFRLNFIDNTRILIFIAISLLDVIPIIFP